MWCFWVDTCTVYQKTVFPDLDFTRKFRKAYVGGTQFFQYGIVRQVATSGAPVKPQPPFRHFSGSNCHRITGRSGGHYSRISCGINWLCLWQSRSKAVEEPLAEPSQFTWLHSLNQQVRKVRHAWWTVPTPWRQVGLVNADFTNASW